MIQELLYTSHQGEGLKKGTGGGFCTVLSSSVMAANLAQALEKLSGYKHPFDAHDPRAVHNPVNHRFCSLRIGGNAYHVFSRISDYRAEHTGRTNKLAHHLIAEGSNRPACGPAVILASSLMRSDWDSVPRLVPPLSDSALALPETVPGACLCWKRVAGDAGWAGAVAEKLVSSEERPVSVIYPCGAEPLQLIAEMFALFPPEHRWGISFSTYFTILPPGTSCRLRFFMDDTQEAIAVRRDFRQETIDLANVRAALTSTKFTDAARSGIAFPISRINQSQVARVASPRDGRERRDLSDRTVEVSEDGPTPISTIRRLESDVRLLPQPLRGSAVLRTPAVSALPPDIPGNSRNARRKDRFVVGFLAGSAAGLLLGICISFGALFFTRTSIKAGPTVVNQDDQISENSSQLNTEKHKSTTVDSTDPESNLGKQDQPESSQDTDGEGGEHAPGQDHNQTQSNEGDGSNSGNTESANNTKGPESENGSERSPSVAAPQKIEDPADFPHAPLPGGEIPNVTPTPEFQVIDIDWNLNESKYSIKRAESGQLEVSKSKLPSAKISIGPDGRAIPDKQDSDLLRDLKHAILVFANMSNENEQKVYRYGTEINQPDELDFSELRKSKELDNLKNLRLRPIIDRPLAIELIDGKGQKVDSEAFSKRDALIVRLQYNTTKVAELKVVKPDRVDWTILELAPGVPNVVRLQSVTGKGKIDVFIDALDADELLRTNGESQDKNGQKKDAFSAVVKQSIEAWGEVKRKGGVKFLKEISSKPFIEAYIPKDDVRSLPERVVARYRITLVN